MVTWVQVSMLKIFCNLHFNPLNFFLIIFLGDLGSSFNAQNINKLGEDSGEIQLPIRPFVLPDIDPEIIGFSKDRDHIVKELLDETTKRRSVVSIWGAGGLGKTTLAQKVYNRYVP